MKKILSILVVIVVLGTMFGLVACDDTVYGIGDTQEIRGVKLRVKSVSSAPKFYGAGYLVSVMVEIENTKAKPYTLSYLDFTLNDGYTLRKTDEKSTNIEGEEFKMLPKTTYVFYINFSTEYAHDMKDMIFIWKGKGSLGSAKKWVL